MLLYLQSLFLFALISWHRKASGSSFSGLHLSPFRRSIWEIEARVAPKLPIHNSEAEERSLSRRDGQSSSVGITRTQGVLGHFVVSISIGTQDVDVILNTCSNLLWVMSTAMDPNAMQQNPGHQYFDPAKSTTYKGMLGNWTAGFAKGTMVQAGFRANETVNIGQVRTMDPIGFGGATDMNKHLWGANFSGNLGVSWLSSGSINNGISTNFMSWVRDSLSKPLLTLDCDSQRGEGYWMSIGSVDPLRYDGSLTVIPIMDQNVDSWTVQVRSYWIGGQMLGADSYTDSMPLTFDTAATSCTVHGDVAGDYWKQVPGATQAGDGTWVWPCLEPTPDFTIQWEEGSDWTMIPGKVLNNATRSIIMGNGNDSWCYGGLQNAADVRAVMGTPFFEGVYTSFDYHDATVSMAPYKGEGGNITNDIPGDVSGHATTPLSTAIDTSTAAAAGTETGSAAGTATQVGTSNTQPSASSGGSVQAGSSGQAATTAQTATTGQATTTAQAGSSTQPASAS